MFLFSEHIPRKHRLFLLSVLASLSKKFLHFCKTPCLGSRPSHTVLPHELLARNQQILWPNDMFGQFHQWVAYRKNLFFLIS